MNTLIIVNGIVMFGIVAALFAVVALAHRGLAAAAEHSHSWGLEGPGVPSEPLPRELLDESELLRAA